MDNTTILFNAITRTYRNGMVRHIRETFSKHFGDAGEAELPKMFGSEKWNELRDNAHNSRSETTGGIVQTIRDEYELLGVERFFNIFEKHFDLLCPKHAGKPKREKNQARTVLCNWLKQIKNVRDPIAHPITDDIEFDDAYNTLFCARKALDFCELSAESEQVINAQTRLLGGINAEESLIVTVMPPDDEVVVDFVGRQSDLEALSKWFDSDSKRFALSGEGGLGKSAIAYSFAKSVSRRKDHDMEAVIWLSAKQRRFIEGRTVQVGRPDFYDKNSAICKIIEAYGETPTESAEGNELFAMELLNEFPALLVVDDIDTVEGAGENAIEFLMMSVPERTSSRALFTSRREMFGAQSFTRQIRGLEKGDDVRFVESRCDLMGIPKQPVLAVSKKIIECTDGSPLYIEDLLRLSQAGLDVDEAIGIWMSRGGDDARMYAIKREYDHLNGDSKQVLLALALGGPSKNDELCKALDWPMSRLAQGLQELRKMFLMPSVTTKEGKNVLTLNRNIQLLVLDAFSGTDAIERIRRLMQAASGELSTTRYENRLVGQIITKYDLLRRQLRYQDAKKILIEGQSKFPGRYELHSALGYVYKQLSFPVEAVEQFKRAHDLGYPRNETYWHWSIIESDREEWKASAEVAELGLQRFPNDTGLVFCLGYATHRRGKELITDGKKVEGQKLCLQSEEILVPIIQTEKRVHLISKIFRSLVINSEVTENIPALKKYLEEWQARCPNDRVYQSELNRLVDKFPIAHDA